MSQAEVNHGSACPSTLKDEDSQPPQRVSPNFPELAQLPSDPCKTIINCPETVLKNLDRNPKVSLGKVLEILPDIEVESSYTRHERSDTQNVSLVGPDKQQLEGTLVIHLSSKCKDIDHSKMPMEKPSFCDLSTCNKDSNGPSFLDAGTQKMLETHLTRRLVRHRWSLPLRGIKTIHVFQRNKAITPFPFPQTSSVYLSFGDSGDDSIPTTASVLGETFQQDPEETVMKGDSPVESKQNSPPALQLELLTATPHSDNSIPSEAFTTIQDDSSTALSTRQDLIGRVWHNNVLKSSLGNPEPTPDLVRGMCQSPGNEHGSLRDVYQGVRNNSSASLSPSSRNTRELEEVEEKDSCEWALTKPARELGNSSCNNKHLRDFGSLKITEILPSPRTKDHMPEDSGLATRHSLAPGVVLQDCATGVFLQDCAREVLLAADIMASSASQSSSKTKSTTRTSISQDSMLRRLVNAISFCRQLRQDTLGEVSNPEVARINQRLQQPREETVDTDLSLADSFAPLKEHLLPKDSKILSPVLLNALASIESQLSRRASQPPETLTPGRCCSPPRAHAQTSHPPDPVVYSPSLPNSRMEALKCDRKALGTPQSTPLPGLPSPIPNTLGLIHAKRPNRVTPGEITDPQLQEHLEQHLKKRYIQLHGQSPDKDFELCLDLLKPQEEPQGMGQAEVNHGSACPSTLKDEDSQPPQRVSPNFPELAQLLSDPCKTITNCPETVLKNLDRSPKDSLGKVLEIMPDVEVESSYTRHERSDTQNVSPVGPDKQQLEGTLVIHLSSKCKDINHSKMPMAKTSFQDLSTYNKDSNGPSFLDAGTQKMLETHLTRRLVRHRWSLPLRGIKTIHVFQRKKAVSTLPFPQTSNVYLSFGDSGDDSISTTASVLLETFQQAPEETVMKGDSPVESTQNSPPALQLEDLTATPHSDNSIPSEASTTIQEDSSTALSTRQDLIGRAWHHNNVLKSSLGNPEPIPDLVRGMCQSPGNEYGSSRDKYQGARNNSSASLSPSSRNTRELEEVEEEDSCELALTKPARELGNSSSNNKHLRDFGSLKITEISPSRTIDHMPEASGQRTRRCLAPPVVLQDCATGVFLQDCAPEVLLAADIMASRASQSSSKTKSTTRTSISQDRYPFSSREGAVPKKSIPQEPWNSHIFGPNYQKEDFKCPRQYICHSGKRPAHDAKSHSHEKKIVDMIKNFVLSIFNPKGKVQPNSRQKVKASSSPTQSQESVANRVFMPHKVTEGQDQKTSAGWVSVEKHRVHHRSAPSSNLQEPTKASMSRHVCHHRIPNVESKITQGNTSCVQQANSIVRSHPSTHKSMPYGNSWAQVLGQPVSQYANVQQMSQVPRVPGTPVHCPRHCCCRSVYGGKASAFPNLK
ncbi:hypothetical protein NN561_019628 [Cricetulus griseus]